jgi:hypothetical protein
MQDNMMQDNMQFEKIVNKRKTQGYDAAKLQEKKEKKAQRQRRRRREEKREII